MSRGFLPLDRQCLAVGLPAPATELRFAPPRRWRFDFAWPAYKLACEVEGAIWTRGRHSRGAGMEKDMEKYNAAALQGWTVLRVSTGMVKDGRALQAVEAALRKSLGEGC